jgi:hypothetical protein
MKINTSKMVLLLSVISLPFSSMANDAYKNNPFVKPSKRTDTQIEKTCDLSTVEDIVAQRLAELIPDSDVDANKSIYTEGMTNIERIRASGAKPILHVNGTDIYFNEDDGVFMYDKKLKPNT